MFPGRRRGGTRLDQVAIWQAVFQPRWGLGQERGRRHRDQGCKGLGKVTVHPLKMAWSGK